MVAWLPKFDAPVCVYNNCPSLGSLFNYPRLGSYTSAELGRTHVLPCLTLSSDPVLQPTSRDLERESRSVPTTQPREKVGPYSLSRVDRAFTLDMYHRKTKIIYGLKKELMQS